MKTGNEPKIGDLRVWWIPQVPGKAFHVTVKSIREARLILDTLARYDLFQFRNHIKPDYCNVGGLEVYVADAGEGKPDWEDWDDEEGEEWEDEEGEDIDHTEGKL